jgi:uncharacterized membrane protein
VTAAVPVRAVVAPLPVRALPMVLAGLLVLTAIAYPLTEGPERDVVSWTIVLLVAGVTAVVFEAIGLATGFPYGRYTYSDALGPTLLGVPFLVPLAWLMMAWPSLLVAGLLTRRRVLRILTAAAVFAAWDVVLDPQLVQAGYWTWAAPDPSLPGIDTVPLTNLAGWLLAGVVLMALLDALVIRTAVPGAPRIGPAAPLLALGWMTLGGALAHACWLGLPGSAAWGAVLFVPLFAVLVARSRRAT